MKNPHLIGIETLLPRAAAAIERTLPGSLTRKELVFGERQDFVPGRIAIATSAAISVAGKSWPTMASAMVKERAIGINRRDCAADGG